MISEETTLPKNDTLIRALLRQPTDYTPIWLMRQAGRYLPEYNKTRANAGSFLKLATNPNFATEVTLQPIQRYKLDAAILFSDILTIPHAMGLELFFVEGEGPKFSKPLRSEKDIKNLNVPDLNKLKYVFDTVSMIKKSLKNSLPLIGFSGSPWTLACYMIEGEGSKDFHLTKKLMFNRPDLLNHILEINSKIVASYLIEQIKNGAQVIQIFDSWGGILSESDFKKFSLFHTKKIIKNLKQNKICKNVPIILFTKGGSYWLNELSDSGADALGLDWTVDIGKVKSQIGKKVSLQGNLDPIVLLSNKKVIEQEVKNIIGSFGKDYEGFGHVFNLGHGISKFTPIESVEILVEAVHSISKRNLV
tara:strand:+ start:919 stop:2004 length:1086 start_codon:yes stop_codon:yes gene_type:complete